MHNAYIHTCAVSSCRGYCAPEYESGGKPSKMADVYSLGVIITELITGRKVDPNKDKVSMFLSLHRWLPFIFFVAKIYFFS